MTNTHYDLMIIGGGISGTALLYLVSHYSNIKKIALVEKYAQVALVNSHARNNSQTLHCGDIETNYSLKKAKQVQQAAKMIVQYIKRQDNQAELLYQMPKMVIGIGEREIKVIKKRAEKFSNDFPYMKLIDKKQIAKIEPKVATKNGQLRQDDIMAFACENHDTAVDFAALARSFLKKAQEQNTTETKEIDTLFNTRVRSIKHQDDHYQIVTNKKTYTAKSVVVDACGHSLLLAQNMGFGLHFSCLPVAGSFYLAPVLTKGKVYGVQNDKLPFAAIHADRDFSIDGRTRFGPTALLLPMLERYRWSSLIDFLRVLHLDKKVVLTLWDLMKEADIRNYLIKNFVYEIPFIRKRAFLKDAKRIIPDLKLNDLEYARRFGGVRPQLIDKRNCSLLMGEAKIDPGNGIIFNMTPSPGASSCLTNSETDMRTICTHLGATINDDQLTHDLK